VRRGWDCAAAAGQIAGFVVGLAVLSAAPEDGLGPCGLQEGELGPALHEVEREWGVAGFAGELQRLRVVVFEQAGQLVGELGAAVDEFAARLDQVGELSRALVVRQQRAQLATVVLEDIQGTFRVGTTGELVDFTMGPYACVTYLNAEADLRDLPFGIQYLLSLNQDPRGQFTILATMQEQYSSDMACGFSYRLDELNLNEGTLLTWQQHKEAGPDLEKKVLHVRPETRVWKGEQQVKLTDLALGTELLYNLIGRYGDDPGWCTHLYVRARTHELTTERQRQRFTEYQKKRGLPGWVDKTEGNLITVSLFSGDAANFKKTFLDGWDVGREVSVCVANTELGTWNPPVDKERGSIVEMQRFPQDGYGASGVRLIVRVPYMLEGFRRGHVVRLFGQGWTIKDSNYGESLMNYGFARLQNVELLENPAREYPAQFPFRTDYCNDKLPWFQVKEGEAPPPFAEHVVYGELLKADAAAHAGQFRTERTGETVDFTLLKTAAVRYLNAESVARRSAARHALPVSSFPGR
jgi:hypothetical protein